MAGLLPLRNEIMQFYIQLLQSWKSGYHSILSDQFLDLYSHRVGHKEAVSGQG